METPCTTVTWASHTVTVPKVGFSTVPAGSTTSVVLSFLVTAKPRSLRTLLQPFPRRSRPLEHPSIPTVARNYRQDIF
ncbi:hypothetical protein N7470_005714 [Penicillium chermesinum]|nr:hypothetical protein N7470_005714 [Penicillium chermesinum]